MRLLAGLGYDGRNLLYTIREVSLLTPAQLRGHQQLPGLIDAVFVLCHKAENEYSWSYYELQFQNDRDSTAFENEPFQRFSAEHLLGSSLLYAHGTAPLLLC